MKILKEMENDFDEKFTNKMDLDLKIEFEDKRELGEIFDYDRSLSSAYMKILKEMENDFDEKFTNKMDILVRNLNVIKKNDFEIDENEYSKFILEKIQELLVGFVKTKEDEGNRLKAYFMERIKVLESKVEEIKKFKDTVVSNYKAKLLERLEKIKEEVEFKEEDILKEILLFTDKSDISEEISNTVVSNYKAKLLERLEKIKEEVEFKEEDILKEILLFTDKSDISEEISRLDSHLTQLKLEMNSSEIAIGKKIDFILQEIFRELNTTGVKCNLYDISKLVVESKNEAIGKKIDFILQEIFRELNTTGVKCNLYDISKLVVESKNELEKIREQAMNIE